MSTFTAAEREVRAERERIQARWGEQNHPDGTGGLLAAAHRDTSRECCQRAAAAGNVTWRLILAEEVAEAFAEDDPGQLRGELVQAAAVVLEWIDAIDRRNTGTAPPATATGGAE
ncbi:hypothetical protein [Actinomadura sp. 3N508]|uniref:hypothetical protein n=1 Tax=Actinomadura sp. 3N508 TaxID=3375153 RepID=UPI0037922A16